MSAVPAAEGVTVDDFIVVSKSLSVVRAARRRSCRLLVRAPDRPLVSAARI
jgi:hypothetical protein